MDILTALAAAPFVASIAVLLTLVVGAWLTDRRRGGGPR